MDLLSDYIRITSTQRGKMKEESFYPYAKNYAILASLLLALAMILGAFGSHTLKNTLDLYHFDVFQTASKYHYYNAIGMFMVALASIVVHNKYMALAKICMFAGTVIFSGSLYLLSVLHISWLGAITPIGGLYRLWLGCWWLLVFTKLID